MPEPNKNAIREIPKTNVHVKASTKERSLIRELGKDVVEEVIMPKSRDAMRNMSDDIFSMFLEAIRNIRDGILYPDGNAPNRKPIGNSGPYGTYNGITNYTSYSRPIGTYQSTPQRGRDLIGQRPGNEVDYIWVWTEEDAKKVVGTLKENIDNYGKVKVAFLYEMIEVQRRTTMSDFIYGWTKDHVDNIRYYEDTSRRRDEPRWFIDLPRPVNISNS